MKKLVTLILAAGLVCGLSSGASAAEVKVSGAIDFTFQRADRSVLEVGGRNDFDAWQRLDLNIDFIASEQLSARYGIRLKGSWGGDTTKKYGGDFSVNNQHSDPSTGKSSTSLNTRNLYVDWLIPNTMVKVRMGKAPFQLPAFALGDMVIFGAGIPGVFVQAPINDNFAVTAFWLRMSGNDTEQPVDVADNDNNRHGNADLLGMTLPMKFTGFDFVPWAMYGSLGNRAHPAAGGAYQGYPHYTGNNRAFASNDTSTAWWVGFASRLTMFDPFSIAVDFAYGSKKGKGFGDPHTITPATSTTPAIVVPVTDPTLRDRNKKQADRSGWYVGLKMDYKTKYGIPTLKAWYSSGDGKDTTKASKVMPFVGAYQAAPFGMAYTFFDSGANLVAAQNANTVFGTMGVSLQWNKFSFVENLFHDFSVTYFRGTNHANNVKFTSLNNKRQVGIFNGNYLTTKDSAIDVNLTSTYSIYKNLAASLELGYLFENFDSKIRATDAAGAGQPKFHNIWRAALNFKYTF